MSKADDWPRYLELREADPNRSGRSIARELGISEGTIRNWEKGTLPKGSHRAVIRSHRTISNEIRDARIDEVERGRLDLEQRIRKIENIPLPSQELFAELDEKLVPGVYNQALMVLDNLNAAQSLVNGDADVDGKVFTIKELAGQDLKDLQIRVRIHTDLAHEQMNALSRMIREGELPSLSAFASRWINSTGDESPEVEAVRSVLDDLVYVSTHAQQAQA